MYGEAHEHRSAIVCMHLCIIAFDEERKGCKHKSDIMLFSPRCIAFAALYNTMDRAEAEAGVCDGIVIHSFPVSITLFVLTL